MRFLFVLSIVLNLSATDYQLKCRNTKTISDSKSIEGNGQFSMKSNFNQVDDCGTLLKAQDASGKQSINISPGTPFCPNIISNECDFSGVSKVNRKRGLTNISGTCTAGKTGNC